MSTTQEHNTIPTYDDIVKAASVSCVCGWAKVVNHARDTDFARATAVRLASALGRAHEDNPAELEAK